MHFSLLRQLDWVTWLFWFQNAGSTIMCNFYKMIQGIALPVAIVGLMVLFLIFILRPMAPQMYQQNQESFKSVMIGVAGIALAPTLISMVVGIVSQGGTVLATCTP